jgi:hypothetical protein
MIMNQSSLFKNITTLACGMLFVAAFPLKSMAQTPTSENPAEYVLEDIQGTDIQVKEDGTDKWEPAEEGQILETGDEVKLGNNTTAALMLQSDTSVQLSANTDMKVEQVEANNTGGFFSHLILVTGQVLADVKKHLEESHSTFEVESDGVVCGVRGTAFEVNASGGMVQTSTHEGKVEVLGQNGESHMVEAGNASSFQRGMFRMQRRLDQREIGRFQKWRAYRQIVMQKRAKRLEDIRNHRRARWIRKHNHAKKKIFHREMMERRHTF